MAIRENGIMKKCPNCNSENIIVIKIEKHPNDNIIKCQDCNEEFLNEEAYLIELVSYKKRSYNPKYGDDRICECGHPYHKHFDSYEDMEPCGCKYCQCRTFVEKT